MLPLRGCGEYLRASPTAAGPFLVITGVTLGVETCFAAGLWFFLCGSFEATLGTTKQYCGSFDATRNNFRFVSCPSAITRQFVGDNLWQLVRIVALNRYGSLLSAGTDRCSELVRFFSTDRCSQLVRVVALSWYDSLPPAGTESRSVRIVALSWY